MISTDDLEYPREYRTLGNARRFSNVGLVHTSEHRHTVTAAQSLEALTNLHKADMERKRDAFMDHLKSKYQQQQQQLQHPHHSPHHNPPSPSPSHSSMRGSSERSAREQVQKTHILFCLFRVHVSFDPFLQFTANITSTSIYNKTTTTTTSLLTFILLLWSKILLTCWIHFVCYALFETL